MSNIDVPNNLIKPKVPLVGEDGNAFAIMSRVSQGLRQAGNDEEVVESYMKQATSGDYDHLLAVSMAYIEFPSDEDAEFAAI